MRALRPACWTIASLVALAAMAAFIATPLDLGPQLGLGVALILAAIFIGRHRQPWITHLLAVCSIAASARYLCWRLTYTVEFESVIAWLFGGLLLLAELYAFVILVLGYVQTAEPLPRRPIPLPADRSRWPTIDVFIPSYNEPLDVVRATVLAALALDWPKDKLNVYLLDDGRRPAFREFASRARAGYIVRPDNKHAKAGNLNHALRQTHGELIAIFDCDHVAARSFLQFTAGWFLKDERLALVQTPHHFYNPDPIERNMRLFRRVPNEGELFYGLIQNGNDFWNACFFCGSCALIRRSALESLGGISTESITEDALTALRLQRRGYNTAYIGIRQAAGLATDTLAAHVGQRIRWAQGMVQILRLDNPLFGRGLRLGQRLCYLNAMLHFLYGVPRLVFLASPLAYLLFGLHICHAEASTLLAYALPHLVLAQLVNSRKMGRVRYSFWDQVYETVLAFYILVPTLTAIVKPRAGVFKVTAKGEMIETGGLDWQLARPYVVLLFLLLLGMAFGLVRLLFWDEYDAGTVLINLVWSFLSVVMLGAALTVAWETPQRRSTHRVPLKLRAMLALPSGHTVTGETIDLSLGGCSLRLAEAAELAPDSRVQISVFIDGHEWPVPARIAGGSGRQWRFCFDALGIEEESRLVAILFGRPDAWLDWDHNRAPDRPLVSVRTIAAAALQTLGRVASVRQRVAAGAALAIVTVSMMFLFTHTGWRIGPVAERVLLLGRQLTGTAEASVAQGTP